MNINNSTSEEIKTLFLNGSNRTLSEKDIFTCVSNLKGFSQTLLKMKIEMEKNEKPVSS